MLDQMFPKYNYCLNYCRLVNVENFMFFCRWNKLVELVCNPIAQVHFGLKKFDMRRVTNHLINWLLLQLPWIISKKSIWNLCCSITEEILDDLTPLCSSYRWLPSSVQIYPHNLLLIYLSQLFIFLFICSNSYKIFHVTWPFNSFFEKDNWFLVVAWGRSQ